MTNEQQRHFEERLESIADCYKYYVERYNEETSKKYKHDYECICKGFEGEYLGAVHMAEILGLINSEESYEYLDKLSLTNE